MPPAPPPAAPQPTYEQRQQAEKEQHERQYRDIMAEVATRLHEITDLWNAQRLLAFLNIVRDDEGCTTPAEEFLLDLLQASYYRGVTPEYVDFKMGEFRENFNDVLEATKQFTARYAEALKPAAA